MIQIHKRGPGSRSTCDGTRGALWHFQAALGVLQHGLHQLACDTGKPTQEPVHRGAVFEVLKKCARRHPSGVEHSGAAQFPGHPLDHLTLSPIQHRWNRTSMLEARQALAGSLGGRAATGGCESAREVAQGPAVGDRDLAVEAVRVSTVRTGTCSFFSSCCAFLAVMLPSTNGATARI